MCFNLGCLPSVVLSSIFVIVVGRIEFRLTDQSWLLVIHSSFKTQLLLLFIANSSLSIMMMVPYNYSTGPVSFQGAQC